MEGGEERKREIEKGKEGEKDRKRDRKREGGGEREKERKRGRKREKKKEEEEERREGGGTGKRYTLDLPRVYPSGVLPSTSFYPLVSTTSH
jgi:hypothetical protein